MTKRLLIGAISLLFVASLSLAAQDKAPKKATTKGHSYIGWVTDTKCGEKGANAKHADCLTKCINGGEKYALYVPSTKKLYTLDPQEGAAEHGAHRVRVTGTVEGDTIHVTNIAMVGEKKAAPKKAAS